MSTLNKKDIVRTELLKAKDGEGFTIESLARTCAVNEKDVSNVVTELRKNGSLSFEVVNKKHVYTVIKNTLQLWFAKHPIGNKPAPETPETRKSPRSSLVIAIDMEIKSYEHKIKKLKEFRRMYS